MSLLQEHRETGSSICAPTSEPYLISFLFLSFSFGLQIGEISLTRFSETKNNEL